MAGLPGSIQSLMPAGPDELVRRMRDLERRMDEMGPSVAPSFSPVIADLIAKQAMLDAQGVILTAAVADLTTAQANIIALVADTVRGGQAGTFTTNFAVTGTGTSVASGTIAVPAGFTHALVFSTAHAHALNTTAGGDFFYAGAAINGVTPAMISAPTAAGVSATSSGSATRILTGLSGGVITVDAMVHSAFASWTATASNIASIDAIAIFYR